MQSLALILSPKVGPRGRLILPVVWIAFLIFGSGGCGKRAAVPPASPSAETLTPSQDQDATDAQMTEVLSALTQAVRKFAAEQQRVPKSLDELVAHGDLSQIPPAPGGKRFVIGKDLKVYLTP